MKKKSNCESLFYDDENYQTNENLPDWVDEWTFKLANTSTYTHKIHRYPAMFIPQLVRKIIKEYTKEGNTILDIFNGSGSTMVECCLLNRNSIGIELNPLANLIAKVKTTPINKEDLTKRFSIIKEKFFKKNTKFKLIDFKNVDFWFEKPAKQKISKIISIIEVFKSTDEINFFKVCLSEIIREVSNCKHSGFKLHRDLTKVGKKISDEEFFEKFHKVFKKNVDAINKFSSTIKDKKFVTQLIQGSSTKLHKSIKKDSVDLILTSPPYGDSQTTVAYGQFSRLSSQFLGLGLDGLENIGSLDSELLGGKKLKKELYENLCSRSLTLKNVADHFTLKINDKETNQTDKKKLEQRLNDIMSFYYDLDRSLKNGCEYLKTNKHFILVTGSRIVKMIKLHTDLIISELGELYNLKLSAIFYRSIESKRMPAKVSATNVVGEHAPTMTKESIIVLKKSS